MRTPRCRKLHLLGVCVLAAGLAAFVLTVPAGAKDKAAGADWPHWRGPARNGVSAETGWSTAWPKDGLKQLWKAQLGQGFSSVVVRGDRVYTMGSGKDTEIVYCLNADTGEVVWKHSYASTAQARAPRRPLGRVPPPGVQPRRRRRGGMPNYPGPRATPTLDGKTVYTVGKAGHVVSLNAKTGDVNWSKNIQQELGARVPNWGLAGSPLVAGKLLILSAGTGGVALDKATGEVVWQVASPSGAGYASPTRFRMGEKDCVAFMAGKEIVAAAVADGKVLWRHPWIPRPSNNCADPVFSGEQVFVSSAYGAGSAMLGFGAEGAKVIWKNKEMNNHFSSCVLVDGNLYGFDGDMRKKVQLKCLDFKAGAAKWSADLKGSLMVAAGKLVILTNSGELVIAEASPRGYKELARAKVMSGRCWTAPVLAGGRIYCRSHEGELVCVDVSGG